MRRPSAIGKVRSRLARQVVTLTCVRIIRTIPPSLLTSPSTDSLPIQPQTRRQFLPTTISAELPCASVRPSWPAYSCSRRGYPGGNFERTTWRTPSVTSNRQSPSRRPNRNQAQRSRPSPRRLRPQLRLQLLPQRHPNCLPLGRIRRPRLRLPLRHRSSRRRKRCLLTQIRLLLAQLQHQPRLQLPLLRPPPG
jgi:hypothetical protein